MQSLESGEWRPGEAIPSEMELAASYKVSQGTVRKAVDELAAEKYPVSYTHLTMPTNREV